MCFKVCLTVSFALKVCLLPFKCVFSCRGCVFNQKYVFIPSYSIFIIPLPFKVTLYSYIERCFSSKCLVFRLFSPFFHEFLQMGADCLMRDINFTRFHEFLEIHPLFTIISHFSKYFEGHWVKSDWFSA